MADDHARIIEEAVALAHALQERAAELQTPHERRQQAELNRLLQTPSDKVTMMQMTDQAFRSHTAARMADQLTHILDVQGVPRFFSPLDRALLHGFQTFGGWLPQVAVPLMKGRMQSETANVVLPAEHALLARHLVQRQSAGLRMNVNFLGEALLGEVEARHRLDLYLQALAWPEIEVLSVKISTLYSQISPIAREHTVQVLCDRLEPLFRAAAEARFTRADGTTVPKFIYLDMEEYRDLELTAAAFRRTLDRPGLSHVAAGLALQAYIPDSARVQREINTWARARVAKGGSAVTIRLVKGANLEMERVEASLRGWPQAPFQSKAETDANYQHMLREGLREENLRAVRLGIASHNLFDVAQGLLLSAAAGAGERVQFEMLEGMANHQRRALAEHTAHLLLYAPACGQAQFTNAIGYLIRRLDENTGPENFLRHAFRLRAGSEDWALLEQRFREAAVLPISDAPSRTQDRATESPLAQPEQTLDVFINEPDTDFALPANSAWAQQLVAEPWRDPGTLPVVVDGEELRDGRGTQECLDPSRPGTVLARFTHASGEDLARAVQCAADDPDGWGTCGVEERSRVLGEVARELRQARGRLLRAALAEGGKTIAESDPEVSEAIDFVEFYRASARELGTLEEVSAEPKGAVAVISPWNFPIAIPCGGMAAALAAGNRVLLKPATETTLVAWELCQCFWRGGVSRRVLQFVPCSGQSAGEHLLPQPRLAAAILTGGTETARTMLRAQPRLALYAETGGKNATIVTALSDREQAIKHVVHSAFSHGGQKCSATSLLLLEAEVYDDPAFREELRDAVQSLCTGSAWELPTRIGPLIRAPAGPLAQALTSLGDGGSWLVEPRCLTPPNLWSPGIRWDVPPGSALHLTELFGPVLSVMRFTHLAEAIDLVNATGYGLTSGLESLDDREQQQWHAGIRAGNLYLNKPTTGAIVLRQPFGGWGRSSFGPAMKAGGPNYLAQFLRFTERAQGAAPPVPGARLSALHRNFVEARLAPEEEGRLARALASYSAAAAQEFRSIHDHCRLVGEDNFRRYVPFRHLRVRMDAANSPFEVFASVAAAAAAGNRVAVSFRHDGASPAIQALEEATHGWAGDIEFIEESDQELAHALLDGGVERVRLIARGGASDEVWHSAHAAGVYLAHEPVLAAGRIELLWSLREQSLSHAYHRYGNLGGRGGDERAAVL